MKSQNYHAIGGLTYNILRIWRKGDSGSFCTFVPDDFSDDMSVWNGSHASKPISFRFASLNLSTIFFYGGLRAF